jgi:transposase
MPKPATPILLSPDEHQQLSAMRRRPKAQARYVQRAEIILRAAEGLATKEIARQLRVSRPMASKWRTRFEREGLSGLHDDHRTGRPPTLDEEEFRSRLFAQLDQPPPAGHARWDGPLLAKALGTSAHRVWRVLRALGISLKRRRSWCVSTDPQFTQKAADVVGLYLAPPDNAVVLSFDEKPCIQALERAQGWLKMPDGRALTGFAHEYKRHGTSTLFAALNVATGQVLGGHFKRKRRVEFLAFMDRLVAAHPGKELHVILDNLSTHRVENERWRKAHPFVHFHFTPTHASWLNQIEVWFSILSTKALRGASFRSVKQLIEQIDAFIAAYNEDAAPFEWSKVNFRAKTLAGKYSDLCK